MEHQPAASKGLLDGALDVLSTALVLDALDEHGLRHQSIDCGIAPRTTGRPVLGRAKTLLWVNFAHDDPETYALELAAVDSLVAGEIVVCATGGSRRSGIWGELLTTAAVHRGCLGVVTDGAVRDIAQMTAAGFPVFSKHLSAYDSFNRQKVIAYDVRVEIGGVAVEPGDIVVADQDGIAVIPSVVQEKVIETALHKATRENAFRDAVRGGMPLVAAYARFNVL